MSPGRSRTVLLAAAVLIGTLAAPMASSLQAAQLGPRTPVDLSAIILTTADLEDAGLEGFGLWSASPYTLEDDAGFIGGNQQLDADEVEEALDEAGYIGSYVHNQHLPSEESDSSSLPLVRVVTRAYAFDDASGAEAGFAVIADESQTGFEDEPGNLRLGDEAELTEMTFAEDSTYGVPFDQLELEVLLDRLVLEISLFHLEVDGEFVPFSADDTDLIEALGERLIERAEAALDGDTPNLLSLMVQLESEVSTAPYLTYEQIDGDPVRSVWESAESFADRAADDEAAGIVSVLRREQLLTVPAADAGAFRYYNLLLTFERETNAEEYLDAAIERWSEGMPDGSVEEIEAPHLGDQSLAVGREFEDGNDTWVLHQVLIRIGDTVALIWVEQDDAGAENPGIPIDALIEIGEAQAECLDAERCRDLQPIPDDLVDILDET